MQISGFQQLKWPSKSNPVKNTSVLYYSRPQSTTTGESRGPHEEALLQSVV